MNNDVKFIRKHGRIIPIKQRQAASQIMSKTAKRDIEMSKSGKKAGLGFGILSGVGLGLGLLNRNRKVAVAGAALGAMGLLLAGGAEGREMSGKARQKYAKMFKKGRVKRLPGVTGAEATAWEDVQYLKHANKKDLAYFNKVIK